MEKFKIGDEVVVLELEKLKERALGEDEDGDLEFSDTYFSTKMFSFCGKEATIKEIDSDGDVYLDFKVRVKGYKNPAFPKESIKKIQKYQRDEAADKALKEFNCENAENWF